VVAGIREFKPGLQLLADSVPVPLDAWSARNRENVINTLILRARLVGQRAACITPMAIPVVARTGHLERISAASMGYRAQTIPIVFMNAADPVEAWLQALIGRAPAV